MTRIIGTELYEHGPQSAVQELVALCTGERTGPRCVSATGAHGLVIARQDQAFRNTLGRFFLNLPDGMPAVWVGRLKGAGDMRRCYGPDIFADVMRATAGTPTTHFLCGGDTGVAEELRENCGARFGNTNIAGTWCPPFRELDDTELEELASRVDASGADIVWLGLSTPKQERLALRLSEHVSARFLVTVGAAFDFHTDRVRQAPAFVQKIGMEWFFRLCMEPRRLLPRYLEIVPKFIYFNLQELLGRKTPV